VTISRAHRVAETCVALTDTLVSDYDALDRMTMLVEGAVVMLDVTAAAAMVLLDDVSDDRITATAEPRRYRRLEVYAVAIDAEPGEDGVHIGQSVTIEDAGSPDPVERPSETGGAGFAGVHALPMRLRDRTLGVLTLLHAAPGTVLPEAEVRLGQALADAATIGLLHERAVRDPQIVADHLRQAMANRVCIEQAEGVLAQHGGLSPAEALSVIRSYSRRHKVRLSEVAGEIVAGRLDLA